MTLEVPGWRSESRLFRSTPLRVSGTRPAFREDWAAGIPDKRWVSYGTPAPYVYAVKDQDKSRSPGLAHVATGETEVTSGTERPLHVFLNNGDENFDSGVLSRRAYDLTRGFTLQLSARLPFDNREYQALKIGLHPGQLPDPDEERWSRPASTFLWFVFEMDWLNLSLEGRPGYLPFPEHVDRWRRYTLQVEPDGRVWLLLDGRAYWRSEHRLDLEAHPEARLMLGGRSVGTKILVGPVSVYRGLRYRF